MLKLEVWKTIKLGTGLCTSDDFRCSLKGAGCWISYLGGDLLSAPVFLSLANKMETEVDLMNISVGDLGFEKRTALRDIFARAAGLGFQLCPAEVGPQLRRQYTDQPLGEKLFIAMEPITDSDGHLTAFGVGHDEAGCWLDGFYSHPDTIWDVNSRFIFIRA